MTILDKLGRKFQVSWYFFIEGSSLKLWFLGAINEVEQILKVETSFFAHKETSTETGTVTYDANLFLNNNNVDWAELSVSTGKLTAGATGRYKVAVGVEMLSDSDQDHYLWVMKNGEKMEETKMHSGYSIYASGKGTDNGSRELILDLNALETISLQHETKEGPVEWCLLLSVYLV